MIGLINYSKEIIKFINVSHFDIIRTDKGSDKNMVNQESKNQLYQEVLARRKRCKLIHKNLEKKRETTHIYCSIQEAIDFSYGD